MWCGEHLLAYGCVQTPDEIERRIAAVSQMQIQEVAIDIFRDCRLNAAVITPSKDERAVRSLLTFE